MLFYRTHCHGCEVSRTAIITVKMNQSIKIKLAKKVASSDTENSEPMEQQRDRS